MTALWKFRRSKSFDRAEGKMGLFKNCSSAASFFKKSHFRSKGAAESGNFHKALIFWFFCIKTKEQRCFHIAGCRASERSSGIVYFSFACPKEKYQKKRAVLPAAPRAEWHCAVFYRRSGFLCFIVLYRPVKRRRSLLRRAHALHPGVPRGRQKGLRLMQSH